MSPSSETLTDEELAALAMAADPDTPVDDDAISLWSVSPGGGQLLPAWYMPAPAEGGARLLPPWGRLVVLLLIVSFLAISIAGLCNTYGDVADGLR